MPVDVRGSLSYNPDSKGCEYIIACPQLGIEEDGTGTIEDDIERLRELVNAAIVKEFNVEPKAVSITGYRLGMDFSIEGAVNRTLDEFKGKGE